MQTASVSRILTNLSILRFIKQNGATAVSRHIDKH